MKRLLIGAVGAALVATAPATFSASAATAPGQDDTVSGQASTVRKDGQFKPADLDLALGRKAAPRMAAAATVPSRVRASSKSRYKYKQTIKIKGAVQARPSTTTGGCTANTWCNINVAGDKVVLLKRKAGSKKFKVVDTLGPNSRGKFTFRTKSNGNATYAVYYGGTDTVQPSSASKKIKGTRHPHLRVYTKRGKVYMKANIDPGWERKRVHVQRSHRAKGKFRTWAKPRTNRRGKFRIRLVAPRTGKWHYRLVIPKNNKKFARYISASWGVYKRRR